MSRHDVRDAIAKRAGEIMRDNPTMDRANASARAAYELDRVEKAGDDLTLAQVVDACLASATQSRVAKGAGSWIEAQAETMRANPELLNLRCCGVADLPYAEAVAELRKAERTSDYGDQQTLRAWLGALDALRAAVTKQQPVVRVEKSRDKPQRGRGDIVKVRFP